MELDPGLLGDEPKAHVGGVLHLIVAHLVLWLLLGNHQAGLALPLGRGDDNIPLHGSLLDFISVLLSSIKFDLELIYFFPSAHQFLSCLL